MNPSEPSSRHHEALLAGGWRGLRFERLRDGVDIHVLHAGEPCVALLRYVPGASVPRHRHLDLETVLVLEGSQEDERGRYPRGSLVVNAPGSEHAVHSADGCVVLIQWTRPVEFLDPTPSPGNESR